MYCCTDEVKYFKSGNQEQLNKIVSLSKNPLVKINLESYRKYYHSKKYLENPYWDRICITTLFTFYWQITIDTINFFKHFCKNQQQVFIGGIAATVVPNDIEKETGIKPIQGLLDKGREFDDNGIIIDNLPLDYSILDEIDYVYPEHDAYFGYTTRGCINRCPFCVVPKLEPEYKSHVKINDNIKFINERFGEKRHLLLLDNNVLASNEFDEIIDEIKATGFAKNDTFVTPNYYTIAIKNLSEDYNVPAHIRNIIKQYKELYDKNTDIIKKEIKEILIKYNLIDHHTATKENILEVDEYFRSKFAKLYNNSKPKKGMLTLIKVSIRV